MVSCVTTDARKKRMSVGELTVERRHESIQKHCIYDLPGVGISAVLMACEKKSRGPGGGKQKNIFQVSA